MSFSFKWPRFSDQFHETAVQLLNNALNKGVKPPVIADKIEVVELEMGSQPPELEIRDIGDLTTAQFRGIFRMNYAGDAHIVLRTKVQANPLYHKKTGLHQMGGSKGMLAANQPLVVPMLLRLSNFRLNSVVVLVVSKPKGITLVFKTDPLQNVDIHSTFDSIAVIQTFIQKEIEEQLRQMFREDLPGIIHKLSQQWVKKSTTVETPYLHHQPLPPPRRPGFDTLSDPEQNEGDGRYTASQYAASLPPMSAGRRYSSILPDDIPYSDISDRLPYNALARLRRETRGLADLAEEVDGSSDREDESFDFVDAQDAMSTIQYSALERRSVVEYESIPAVGGGVVTRPRILHTASLGQSTTHSTVPSRVPSSSQLTAPALEQLSRSLGEDSFQTRTAKRQSWESTVPSEPFRNIAQSEPDELLGRQRRSHFGGRSQSQEIASHDADTPQLLAHFRKSRRDSFSSQPTLDLSYDPDSDPNVPRITLRPGAHSTISQLTLLNHSNNTLSPFTRTLEHVATRVMPASMMTPSYGISPEKQSVKAKRKRIYRLGGTAKSELGDTKSMAPGDDMPTSPRSVASGFDQSDVDLYFRTQELLEAQSSMNVDNYSTLRHRSSRRTLIG